MSSRPSQVVVVTGMSGSGKSVVLHALEDASFYCVDNLPVSQLALVASALHEEGKRRIAVAVDVRSGSIERLSEALQALRTSGHQTTVLFLDARDEVLLHRFSETRRRHPLSLSTHELPDSVSPREAMPLTECIDQERALLDGIPRLGITVDTSDMPAASLKTWVKDLLRLSSEGMSLHFQSFGFKIGLPLDADLVFDVRCLPNPHYVPALKPQTGRDVAVMEFLRSKPAVLEMEEDIAGFLERWLPSYREEQRSSLSVAIGCTGGQHRSVYLAEALALRFSKKWPVSVRHRSLAMRGMA